MEVKVCSIDGCNKPVEAKSYCVAHYTRYRRHGDPLAGRKTPEKHKMKGTKIHFCWGAIKQRCTNQNNPQYPNYGGRGISMCDRWQKSFNAFYEDMGEPPTPEHSIERKDVDGNYEPLNCYWADYSTQSANRRPKANMTGFIGVKKEAQKWRARVNWKGVTHTVGLFDTPEEAATWRDAYVIANGWPHTLNCSVGA